MEMRETRLQPRHDALLKNGEEGGMGDAEIQCSENGIQRQQGPLI